ncbi:hypothetical protein C8R46DRAFT_1119979, partial [Mycena filopes]
MNSTNKPSNATADSVGSHAGIGSKIKGAAQTINGIGENVRGTILGGVETALHKDSTENDAIAAKGRAQTADGLAHLKGGTGAVGAGAANTGGAYTTNPPAGQGYNTAVPPPPTTGAHAGYNTAAGMDQFNPHHDQAAAAQNIPAYDGPGNAQQQYARGDRPDEEPRHHRDDAISTGAGAVPPPTNPPHGHANQYYQADGVPADTDAVNIGQANRGLPPKYTSVAGGPPTDFAAQNRGTGEEM